MAQYSIIDDDWSDIEYVVSRDDGSSKKHFKDSEEAHAYLDYLQQLDNQQKMIDQNQQMIDNQKKFFQQSQYVPPRPQFVTSQQKLDPEYAEWLRFQKATDPKYIAWKRQEEQKKRDAEVRAREEEQKRLQAERNAAELKLKQEAERLKKEKELQEKAQKEIEVEVNEFLSKKKLSSTDRVKIAKATNNPKVIRKLIYDKAVTVLDALLNNPNISNEQRTEITRRKQEIQTTRTSYAQSKQENSGCLSTIIITIVLTTFFCSFILL